MSREWGLLGKNSIPYILLVLKTITHESKGFFPGELICRKNLRTPETLPFEKWANLEEKGTCYGVHFQVFRLKQGSALM